VTPTIVSIVPNLAPINADDHDGRFRSSQHDTMRKERIDDLARGFDHTGQKAVTERWRHIGGKRC